MVVKSLIALLLLSLVIHGMQYATNLKLLMKTAVQAKTHETNLKEVRNSEREKCNVTDIGAVGDGDLHSWMRDNGWVKD